MINIPDGDISITLNQSFANKILDSVSFPLSLHYQFKQPDCALNSIADAECTEETGEDLFAMDTVLTEPVLEYFEEAIDTASAEYEQKQRRFKINFYNIELDVPQKPLMSFGNPIVFEDITLRVKARFKASVMIYGKEYSTEQTSPWITLGGRSASIELTAEETKIKGNLTLNQIDLKLKLKFLQWEYECLFDLTKLLNQQIHQRGAFELLDLAGLHRTAIPHSQPLTIANIQLKESADQLVFNLQVGNSE